MSGTEPDEEYQPTAAEIEQALREERQTMREMEDQW